MEMGCYWLVKRCFLRRVNQILLSEVFNFFMVIFSYAKEQLHIRLIIRLKCNQCLNLQYILWLKYLRLIKMEVELWIHIK